MTTPNDNSATNDAPAFQALMSAGDGALLVDLGKTYWCTTSACTGGPPLAAWTDSLFYSVAGGVLPDGRPVLAGLTQVHGDTLRLSLLGCTRRACTVAGGGTFIAPGFNPATGLNDAVYAASANGAGFAVTHHIRPASLLRGLPGVFLEEALGSQRSDTGIRQAGGGHLWSRAHTAASSRESLPGWPEMVVSPQRSQEVSTAPEERPRWEKGAKVL